MLALTRAMPDNWLGLRLAILFRRLVDAPHRRGLPRHDAVGHAAAALSAPQWLREERAVHAADVRHDGAPRAGRGGAAQARRIHLRRYRGECRALFALSCLVRRRAHARDRAAARHSGTAALPSRGKSCGEGRRACRLRSSDREGEVTLVLNDSDSGGTHIDKPTGWTNRASASASQASRCCRCWRRPASRRSMR